MDAYYDRREAEFWAKAERRGECLIWTGVPMPTGYGQFSFAGKTWTTHRLAWALANGRAPKPGALICHTCDVRPCVEPDHLYEGDQGTNRRDAQARGRLPVGMNHPRSRLSDDQVREIRRRATNGEALRALAREYKVGQRTVQNIVHRATWRHL